MKKAYVLKILSVFVVFCIFFSVCGCSEAENLQTNIVKNNVEEVEDLSLGNDAVKNFSFEFFKNIQVKNENSLISPFSALTALGLAGNGAKGESLAQLEKVFGMDKQALNSYLYTISKKFEQDSAKVKLANSIWFTNSDRFTVKENFLQKGADYYEADIFKVAMDSVAVNKINDWVKGKTEGIIKDIADESVINDYTVMCLINALCFEGEWETEYYSEQVHEKDFKSASGKKQKREFMYGTEYIYLENENSKGFVKPYKNSDFAFVALLPNEEVSLDEYIKTLDYKMFNELMENKVGTNVKTAIPKFESEFEFEAKEPLFKMGVLDIFDDKLANFSDLGSSTVGNIYVESVKQKTFISVAEKGTRAGAATMVLFEDKMSLIEEKTVYLDRPFIYMIIDTNTNVPLFIGTLNEIE